MKGNTLSKLSNSNYLLKTFVTTQGSPWHRGWGVVGESPLLENLPVCAVSLSENFFPVLCLVCTPVRWYCYYFMEQYVLQRIGITCFESCRINYKLNVYIKFIMFLAKWYECGSFFWCRKPCRSSEIILGAGWVA